jgi:hypothetical protein
MSQVTGPVGYLQNMGPPSRCSDALSALLVREKVDSRVRFALVIRVRN